jgi:hypothetical protein
MENLPFYVPFVFALTTCAAILFFFYAAGRTRKVLFVLLAWLLIQSLPSLTGFFTVTDTLPPRLFILLLPPVLTIIILFATPAGRRFIDNISIKALMLLHMLRMAVELVLFWLFLHGSMPQLMTFEGRNFDIVSGITAPLVYYYGFIKKGMSEKILLGWNIACAGILLFTVINGILSVPTPFQQFAFDQPNIAVLYFPFTWLVGLVVPIVLFAHFVAIRQLLMYSGKKARFTVAVMH